MYVTLSMCNKSPTIPRYSFPYNFFNFPNDYSQGARHLYNGQNIAQQKRVRSIIIILRSRYNVNSFSMYLLQFPRQMEAVREIFRTAGGKNSVSAEFSFKVFSAIMDPE